MEELIGQRRSYKGILWTKETGNVRNVVGTIAGLDFDGGGMVWFDPDDLRIPPQWLDLDLMEPAEVQAE